MTEDTKRAIEIMQPLAEALQFDMTADDDILWMDSTPIGISSNNTWATLMEMVGWIFYKRYIPEFREIDIDREEVRNVIQRYWLTRPLVKRLGLAKDEQEH